MARGARLGAVSGADGDGVFPARRIATRSVPDAFGMTCEDVVEATIRAIASGRSQVVPGWKNKVSTFLVSKLPKPVAARLAAMVLAQFRLKKVTR